jgi:hypothetical protein
MKWWRTIHVLLSQAGTSAAAAYDFSSLSRCSVPQFPYVFMFAGYLKAARMPDAPGVWRPAGGTLTSILLGWLAQISSLIAIVGAEFGGSASALRVLEDRPVPDLPDLRLVDQAASPSS